MGRLRLIVLVLLALWGIGLIAGAIAHLYIGVCSESSVQATLLCIGAASLAFPFWILPKRRGPVVSGLSLLAGVGCAFFCTVLGLVPSETVFILNPAIDTQLPPGFSRLDFLRIEPGMNEAQVLDLVGEPAARRAGAELNPRADFDQTWGYGGDGACGWCDAAWRSYSVYFRAGAVLKAVEQWHCD